MPMPKYRYFNGKKYHAQRNARTKREAQEICKNARKGAFGNRPCRARYTKCKDGYTIWIKQWGA